MEILTRTTGDRQVSLQPVMHAQDIIQLQQVVRQIPVSEPLVRYAANIVRATRTDRGREGAACVSEFIRKYQAWGAKARALMHGHSHVAAEDIRAVAHAVLQHRIIVNFTAQAEGVTPDNIIDMILKEVRD